MKSHNSRPVKDIIVDIFLFVAFLVLYEEHATGGPVHEWLGITVGLIMIIHIILHWRWVTCLLKNFFGKLRAVNRVKLILNILIFIAFSTIIYSGLMMSRNVMPALGIRSSGISYWKWLHFTAVDTTLWLAALHIALNWQRIVKMFRTVFSMNPVKMTNGQSDTIGAISGTGAAGALTGQVLFRYLLKSLFILLLAGSVAFFWYGHSFTSAAFQGTHNLRHERINHRQELRGEGYNENHRHGRGNRERHNETSFIGLWPGITKNVLIISMITFGVVLTGFGSRKSKNFHTVRIKKKLRG